MIYMSKFWRHAFNTLILLTLWWGAVSLVAQIRVQKWGVTPTFPYYDTLLQMTDPLQAVWAHFDGVHYLHLAELGYDGTGIQAFFPAYPLLIHFFHETFGLSYFTAGRTISFLALYLALLCLRELFGKQFVPIALCLLLFPASFFLGAVYTESLFLFEVALFFLLLKRQHYWLAAMVGGIASGTRLVGAFLCISLLIELWPRPLTMIHRALLILTSLSGLLTYCAYLYFRYHDPLIFLHVQSLFGASRSDGAIILLPQVLWRYARMIVSTSPGTFLLQRVIFELMFFLTAAWLWWKNFWKIPLAQSIFVGCSILLPTLSGTLSSMPRYVLVLVPWLIPPDLLVSHRLISYLLLSVTLLLYFLSIFAGGVFVS